MIIDETTLRAYVDGELSPQERARIEAVVSNNEDVRMQVQALQASCLPYRAAFESLQTAAIPPALTRQIDALSAVAHYPNMARMPRRAWLRLTAGSGMGLAAAFTTGLFFKASWFFETDEDKMFGPWVHAIASYQALYVRETVDKTPESFENLTKVLAGFRSQLLAPMQALSVPDLSTAGLSFKRAQLLGYGDRPLLQIAYLPVSGKPTALCVLPLPGAPDKPASARRMENLTIVTWHRQGLAFVLAIDSSLDQGLYVGRKISENQYPKILKTS